MARSATFSLLTHTWNFCTSLIKKALIKIALIKIALIKIALIKIALIKIVRIKNPAGGRGMTFDYKKKPSLLPMEKDSVPLGMSKVHKLCRGCSGIPFLNRERGIHEQKRWKYFGIGLYIRT